jgi:hypothetical protein
MFTIVNNTGKAWDNVFIAALQRIIQDDPVEYDLDWNSEAEITGFLNGNPISITGLYLNGAFIAISLYSEDMVILNGDSIILPVPSFKSSYGIVCHGDDNMYQKFPVSITPNASFVFTPDDITENPVID